MARGLNKVLLIGNLGKDPEMKYTQAGTAITSFSVAINYSVRDGDSWKEQVEWVRCVAWEKLAETCNEYLRKGSAVYLEGRLQTRKWEQDGVTKYATEVVLNTMIMLDPKNGGTDSAPTRTGPARPAAAEADDDDIPF